MIEIPSAALTADLLAPHVDFFSIGTNDLTQYTLAVDRVNENVTHLYQPTHPAVLRLIQQTVEAGRRNSLSVCVCGEMAADPMLALLLVGLGVDELSMAPVAVPAVKDAIRKTTLSEARALAARALTARSAAEVLGLCREATRRAAPELLELV
jgi:phosphotransferase system enzyme I (PtsI)